MAFCQCIWNPTSLVRNNIPNLEEKDDNLSYSWVTWKLVISGGNLWYIYKYRSCMSTGTTCHISLKNHILIWFDWPSTICHLGNASRDPCKSAHSQVPWLELQQSEWKSPKLNASFEKAFLSLICSLSLIVCTGSWNWSSEGFAKTPMLAQISHCCVSNC